MISSIAVSGMALAPALGKGAAVALGPGKGTGVALDFDDIGLDFHDNLGGLGK